MTSKKILCVGLICLDVVIECNAYPDEDSDQRCKSLKWTRGGNASNNCTVLSQLGVACEVLGTLSNDYAGKFLKKDLDECNISLQHCIFIEHGECPTSCVLINSENGSRTILHCRRNFPELSNEDFKKIDFHDYSWVHFEGRNVDQVKEMVNHLENWKKEHNPNLTISVELEKARSERLELLSYGDYVFVDKEFARMCGYDSMEATVQGLSNQTKPGAVVICAWGEMGACARCVDGQITTSPSFPPAQVKDTLGAGDTFIASTIFSLLKGKDLHEAIEFGCRMAGAKCGIVGLFGLNKVYQSIHVI